jgi:hypothetical protein
MRIIFNENRWQSIVLEIKCFHGVEPFEVNLLKVTAPPCRSPIGEAGLKLSHPSACPVFKDFSLSSKLRHISKGEGVMRKVLCFIKP